MRCPRRLIIAIDGPAGAGKSTAARRVAEQLGYRYLDTGAMYRAVALKALGAGVDLGDADALAGIAEAAQIDLDTRDGLTHVWLDGEEVTREIRSPAASEAASRVSAVPAVRQALVRRQRQWGQERSDARGGGVVMEGRDIGTVVFPQAEVKIFLDADPGERVQRRLKEVRAKGEPISEQALAAQMQERDQRDSTRSDSPLAQAPDAVYVDTTGLGIGEVEEAVLRVVRDRISNGKEYQ
jgi:CMP/dCMP kinase